jgi:acetolactate synthase small subunit
LHIISIPENEKREIIKIAKQATAIIVDVTRKAVASTVTHKLHKTISITEQKPRSYQRRETK